MIDLFAAIALWCAPMKDVQLCRDQMVECFQAQKENIIFMGKDKVAFCFQKEKLR